MPCFVMSEVRVWGQGKLILIIICSWRFFFITESNEQFKLRPVHKHTLGYTCKLSASSHCYNSVVFSEELLLENCRKMHIARPTESFSQANSFKRVHLKEHLGRQTCFWKLRSITYSECCYGLLNFVFSTWCQINTALTAPTVKK